ncbi:Ldh family oxidoreductase [Thalassomonas actiniarum]|uniref:Ldh family oxidoreductase n=1 Tax=Thalassomonas actiniarum TaxID=485447 RepID=A0AAE9YWF4_9GAMM|nr:Ldh family oxidoreductase [Thalassomonas actiniarum]WDE02118.1 Ldh family oxidoreductase [Thalassomonas actiniarum]
MKQHNISVESLSTIISASLESFDLSDRHKAFISNGLLNPSLWGIDSHGVGLLATYLQELKGGRAKSRPDIQCHHKFPVVGQLDADQALGLVAGFEAVEKSIELAKDFGISAIGVKNSNHFGAAANYTYHAAKQGYICLCVSNADSLVSPYNGTDKLFGTNPLSFAAPGENGDVFCLDMATSQVSLSKIMRHLATDMPIENDWVSYVDRESREIGPLKPLGGYKGQGLAMMVTILTSVLNQSLFDWELSHLYAPPYDEPRQVSHFYITINIEAFMGKAMFEKRLSLLLEKVRESGAVDGETIFCAGDKESKTAALRREQGIPLTQEQWQFYRQLAQELQLNIG